MKDGQGFGYYSFKADGLSGAKWFLEHDKGQKTEAI